MRLLEHLPSPIWRFSGSILFKSWACNHSCCEIICTTALLCLKMLFPCSHPQSLTLSIFLDSSWAFEIADVTWMSHLGLSTTELFFISVHISQYVLCVVQHLLWKETEVERARDALIYNNKSLGDSLILCSPLGPWPTQSLVLSLTNGARHEFHFVGWALNFNVKVAVYLHNCHIAIAPVDMSCQAGHYCSSQSSQLDKPGDLLSFLVASIPPSTTMKAIL